METGCCDEFVNENWKFSLDDLLTNIMIYWTTGTTVSSQRFYKEDMGQGVMVHRHERMKVFVPTALQPSLMRWLHVPEKKKWVKVKYPKLISYSYVECGGHIAAFEEPKLLAQDICKFVSLAERQRCPQGSTTASAAALASPQAP